MKFCFDYHESFHKLTKFDFKRLLQPTAEILVAFLRWILWIYFIEIEHQTNSSHMISDFFSFLWCGMSETFLCFFPCSLWHSHVNCLRQPKYLVIFFFYIYEEEETNPSKRNGPPFSESSTQRVKTLIDTFSKSFGLDLVLLKLKFKTCIHKLKWFDVKWAIFFCFFVCNL